MICYSRTMKHLIDKVPAPVILIIAACMILCSCKCDDTPVIMYFAFEEFNPKKIGTIDQSAHTITIEVPETTDVKRLIPTIDVGSSDCLTLSPGSGESRNFTNPVTYEVTNELEEMVQYLVTVIPVQAAEPDNVTISWSTGSDIPVAQGWTAVSVLDGEFYVTGGISVETGAFDKVQIYDPVMNTWRDLEATMNQKRWGHSSSEVDGKLYVMGGTDQAQGMAHNSIEVYDSSTKTWTTSGEMTNGRIGHGAVTHQGKIYIMGGEYEEPSLTTLRSMEVYDPVSGEWESLAPMITSRIFMGACVVDDIIYVLGGGSKYPYPGLKSIEAYNIAENSWERKADLKVGLGDLRVAVMDGKIICFGGYALWTDSATNVVQVYDPELDQSYLATDLIYQRSASAVAFHDGKFYVMTGNRAINPEPSFVYETEIGTPEF